MIKNFLIATMTLLLCTGASLAQGVDFREINFTEALERATVEKKPIFMDCYTEWCGPCKHMENRIFPLQEIGNYFNKRYVCIKVDMEKGEGVDLKAKYKVKAYPTFLVIDWEGEVLHRVIGGGSPVDFIARVDAVLKRKKSSSALESEYESGEIGKKDLTTYWMLLRGNEKANAGKIRKVGDKLYGMLSKRDKLKEFYWPLVSRKASLFDSEGVRFILANLDRLRKNIGAGEVDRVVGGVFGNAMKELLYLPKCPERAKKLEKFIALVSEFDVPNKDKFLIMAQFADAKMRYDAEAYFALLEENLRKVPDIGLLTGIDAILPEGEEKVYYTRLHDFASELATDPSMSDHSQRLDAIAKGYKRKSHVGVYWDEFDSLEDAIRQGKQENRLVFVDCYTEWCGPCKYMTQFIFPMEKLGDYFNKRFINVKIDMEKGEGPEVAKKYGVRAYPTFLVIDFDGSMRHMVLGASEDSVIIENVDNAFDPDKALGLLDKKFENGERNRDFLLTYMKTLRRNNRPQAADIAQLVFESYSELERFSPDNWEIFGLTSLSPAGSQIEKFLFANAGRFREAIGREKVDERIATPYIWKLTTVINGRDKRTTAADIDRMVAEIETLDMVQGQALISQADIARLVLKGDKDVRDYKKAAGNMKPENTSFPDIYRGLKRDLTPAQLKEWKAWGWELAEAAKTPWFITSVKKALLEK